MQQKLLFILFLATFGANAQTPIFDSNMAVSEEGSTDSPFTENVWNIIDGDINTKFLDFDYFDGIGFTVDLGGVSATATGIEITTANDSEGRDPMNYEILGSNDGTTFTSVTTGSIPCITDRFNTRTFNFANTTPYAFYRLLFTDQCSADNSLQISEVQLLGTVLGVNETAFNEANVSVYPNPSKGSFYIRQTAAVSVDKVVILNAIGGVVKEVVFAGGTNESAINTEDLSGGIYFAKIYSGGASVTKKLILNN